MSAELKRLIFNWPDSNGQRYQDQANRLKEDQFKYCCFMLLSLLNITLHFIHAPLLCSEVGRLMARYCVAFDTIKMFIDVTGTENLSDLVGLLLFDVYLLFKWEEYALLKNALESSS